MHELGQKLRAAREARHISIDMLAERTKINPRYLLSMEETTWDFLPQAYIQGMVRKYAAEVGLDGDELLKQYAWFEIAYYNNEEKHSAEKSAKIQVARSRILFSPKIRVALFSLAGLLLLLIFLLLFLCSASDRSASDAYPENRLKVDPVGTLCLYIKNLHSARGIFPN